ncbi:MAG TPA: hypothetical protein VFB54_17485, partial [Burkholderiales bacterium]|nr:hypothetical protein [Burkholderiales bacterium]
MHLRVRRSLSKYYNVRRNVPPACVMTPGEFLLLVLAWLLLAATLLMLVFRAVITKAVLEPVLRHPVFIIESDDWGFGPLEQAERLKALATLLARFRNGSGRCPVMTLG